MSKLIVNIPKSGMNGLVYWRGVHKKEAMEHWVTGYMRSAKKHPEFYHQRGIKLIEFRRGLMKMRKRI